MDKIWIETLKRIDDLEMRMDRIEKLAREPLAEMEAKSKLKLEPKSESEPEPPVEKMPPFTEPEPQQENQNDKVDNVHNPDPAD